MSNIDKFVNEGFVDELMKSGVWDIARVERGTREEEDTINENTNTEEEQEELTAQQLAEDLLNNLSQEVILEFVNLLHKVALNEVKETGETEDIDESLLNTIDESFTALEEKYDISESTLEEIMEAVIDSIDEDDLEDYEAKQIMEALMVYLNEKRGSGEDCPPEEKGGKKEKFSKVKALISKK